MKIFYTPKVFVAVSIALVSNFCAAQTTVTVYPAAWVWEVRSPTRTIYLMGELHTFIGDKAPNVDYQPGFEIYKKVSRVWIENLKIETPEYLKKEKLSSKITDATWGKIKSNLETIPEQIQQQGLGLTRKAYAEKFMWLIDKESVFKAVVALVSIGSLKHNFLSKNKKETAVGLTLNLISQEKIYEASKIEAIETTTLLEEQWSEKCSSNLISDQIINQALFYLDEKKVPSLVDAQVRLQNYFASPETQVEEFFNDFTQSFPEAEIFTSCGVASRNATWLKKIHASLASEGLPEAFLVGIMHVGGPNGILKSLEQESFSIKRLYK